MPPKKKQEKPEFLKQLEKENSFDIVEYLKGVFGREPHVKNSKRRWRFLVAFSNFVYQRKKVNFLTVVRWFGRYAEVMNFRTVKENYIDYLETLGVIEWNENSKTVKWKGEVTKLD